MSEMTDILRDAMARYRSAQDVGATEYACVKAAVEPIVADFMWQPIETAPKVGEDVLLWVSGIPMVAYWLSQMCETPGWHISDGHKSHLLAAGTPTHWMPLPLPPTV